MRARVQEFLLWRAVAAERSAVASLEFQSRLKAIGLLNLPAVHSDAMADAAAAVEGPTVQPVQVEYDPITGKPIL